MHRLLSALSVVWILTACGFDVPPPSADLGGSESKPVPTGGAPIPSLGAGTDGGLLRQFSDALVLSGVAHFRFDRVREAKAGGKERQLFLEIMGLSEGEAGALAATSLGKLGYEVVEWDRGEKGIKMTFRLSTGESIFVWVRSRDVHSKLKHSKATASVYVTQAIVP